MARGPRIPTPIEVVEPDPSWPAQYEELAMYAATKRSSADASNAVAEDVMSYNFRKQPVIREILDRMFRAHGMLD